MDTFHVTSKAVSSCGHKHMQLLVSDKGFVYVVPTKDRTGTTIANAVKQFAKEIGVPMDLIFDASGEQHSSHLTKTTAEMDLTLRLLERKTQWANLTELYIGLIK